MNEADASNTAADNADTQPESPDAYSLTAALQTDAQKFAFEIKLAEMDEHLDKIDLAVGDLHGARSLVKDAAQKKPLDARIAALTEASTREAQNAERRPAIKDDLQLTTIVRPRLTSEAPAQTPVRSKP